MIGASTGYGLASRITAAFGSGAATLGVFYDRPSEEDRPATPGWYNTIAFERAANGAGLYARSLNGDAFSDAIKQQALELIHSELGPVDLVVYSVASPRRVHPKTGAVHKSVLKPVGQSYTNKTVDTDLGIVSDITIEPATSEEIADTVAVMGGEDWELWMQALDEAGLLAPGATSVSYSYIGPEVTWPIYRNGTIGLAKNDLERAARRIDAMLKAKGGGRAFVSINKALVTQASSAIPVVPLYISVLYKIMKAQGTHEGCIEQIQRLFATQMYDGAALAFDEGGRVRLDDREMRPEVQRQILGALAADHDGNARRADRHPGLPGRVSQALRFRPRRRRLRGRHRSASDLLTKAVRERPPTPGLNPHPCAPSSSEFPPPA